MRNRFADLKELLDKSEEDFTKFYDKGNAAAGTRVRAAMQIFKDTAQEIRVEVQAAKNAAK